MKSQWIILLDCSGSMASQFASDYNFKGFTEQTENEIKFEAAKEILLKQLISRSEITEVVIIPFNSAPTLSFVGMTSESTLIQTVLDKLEPSGGTNIPDAIIFGIEQAHFDKHPFIPFLIISDGLSKEGNLDEAINALRSHAVIVDTILIAPTAEGEAIAKRISINGKVTGVNSSFQLTKKVQESVDHFDENLKSYSKFLAKSQMHSLIGALVVVFALFTSMITLSTNVFNLKKEAIFFTAGTLNITTSVILFIFVFKKMKFSVVTDRFGKPFEVHRYGNKTRKWSLFLSTVALILGLCFDSIAIKNKLSNKIKSTNATPKRIEIKSRCGGG